jgi:glycosyltransferase A (GT-A) superfamily protein (DUF2064 family)
MAAAADLAAAALLDTLEACTSRFGAECCELALAGRLEDAERAAEIEDALAGWTVFPQAGTSFADRLGNAHREVGRRTGAAVVQVGMDTPQLTGDLLGEVVDELHRHEAVLGPAEDGGWWVLGLRETGHARALHAVPTSTPRTGALTERALAGRGLDVRRAARLRDVDTLADAEAVAADAPGTRFAAAWRRCRDGAGT